MAEIDNTGLLLEISAEPSTYFSRRKTPRFIEATPRSGLMKSHCTSPSTIFASSFEETGVPAGKVIPSKTIGAGKTEEPGLQRVRDAEVFPLEEPPVEHVLVLHAQVALQVQDGSGHAIGDRLRIVNPVLPDARLGANTAQGPR
ncbi:MAG: hypothetical protein NCA08_03295 [Deltaproteobacteria bacterium]|nr:hypothetical protein [Candidatus Deferrimicrobium borealis]